MNAKKRAIGAENDSGNDQAKENAFAAIIAVCDSEADMTPNEHHVLTVLARYANGRNGEGAYPSARTLAKKTRICLRSVKYALSSLEAKGLLVRGDQSRAKKRPEGGSPVVVWNLNMEALASGSATVKQTPDGEQRAPHALCSVHHMHQQRAPHAPKQPIEQPMLNSPKTASPKGEGAAPDGAGPSLGKKMGRTPKQQRDAEDFDLATVILDDNRLTDDDMTASKAYALLLANGVTKPGRWLDGVAEQSQGIGDGVAEAFFRRIGA